MSTFERRSPKEIQHEYESVEMHLYSARQLAHSINDDRDAALDKKVRGGLYVLTLYITALLLFLMGWLFSVPLVYPIGWAILAVSSLLNVIIVNSYDKRKGKLDTLHMRAKDQIEYYQRYQRHLLLDLRIAQGADAEMVDAVVWRMGE